MTGRRAGSTYRLGILVSNLKPGGAERQMLALAEHLPQDTFGLEFLTHAGAGIWDDRATAMGIPIVRVGTRSYHRRSPLIRAAGRASKLAAFLRLVRSRRYDLIDAWIHPTDALAALSRSYHRATVVVSGHRDIEERSFFGPFGGLVEAATARLADASVANSEAVGRIAVVQRHVQPSKLHVIRNGIEPFEPLTDEERRRRRRELGLGAEDVAIAVIAQLRDVKRHVLLVEAFADIAAERPAACLVIIGDGPMRESIEASTLARGLGGRVTMAGTVPESRHLVGAVDVVVQSSIREGLPNSILEAGAAGRAIVATDAGGTSEIVIDGDTGLLVPTEDRAALAAGLARLIDDRALRDRLGGTARDHVRATFGMERMVREFGDLYVSLIEAARDRSRRR